MPLFSHAMSVPRLTFRDLFYVSVKEAVLIRINSAISRIRDTLDTCGICDISHEEFEK
jgi:hypothetical protein